ncbi:XRE family transcriptional regulator [Asticcacaulis sp. AND118]|uniref:XRE family transcriptional regulator n=1 Tax=Asticcacaulis sp. AND118 TaxID=2840468 RepID=UPI001CFFFE0B|nr:XRE family transcriptional regulator [Asticcacaulis sp. AND118]UDF05781.1 helix-turn-helix domain-containing protein [Asticcacaulis sp. AND118]
MSKAMDKKGGQQAHVKGRTLNEVLAAMPQERREQIEVRAAEKLREIEGLKALRKLTHRSQEQIAQSLGVKQPSVLKIERQADLYLSTLRRFVEAAGGKLELRVELPGAGAFVLKGIGTDEGDIEAQHVA